MIKQIIKGQQPKEFEKLNKKHRQKRGKHLSFSDYEKMMQHDSYKRGKGGAFRQVRHA